MKILKSLLVTSVLLLTIIACKNPEQLQEPATDPVLEKEIFKATIVTDFRAYGGSTPVGIQDVSIDGNIMSMMVKYTGGCKEHTFQLLGHKMISKSNPPIRGIRLFHNGDNDDCRQVIEERLFFDISSLAGSESEITLSLDGYADKINYRPVP